MITTGRPVPSQPRGPKMLITRKGTVMTKAWWRRKSRTTRSTRKSQSSRLSVESRGQAIDERLAHRLLPRKRWCALSQQTPGRALVASSGVQSFAMEPGGGFVDLLTNSGTLYRVIGDQTVGESWHVIAGSGVQSFTMEPGGGVVDLLTNSGTLYRVIGDQTVGESWHVIAGSGVRSFIMEPGGGVMDLLTNSGTLYRVIGDQTVGESWHVIAGSGVQSFTMEPGGGVVDLLTNSGTLYRVIGDQTVGESWHVIAGSGVQSFTMEPGGGVVDLLTDSGTLYRVIGDQTVGESWYVIAGSGAQSFTMEPCGGSRGPAHRQRYALPRHRRPDRRRELARHRWLRRAVLHDGARRRSCGPATNSGTLYRVIGDQAVGESWHVIAGSGVQSFTMEPGGGVVDLLTDSGTLYRVIGDQTVGESWYVIDTSVAEFAMAPDGTVVTLETNGNLYSFLPNSSTHTLIDMTVASFALSGRRAMRSCWRPTATSTASCPTAVPIR